MSHQRDLCVTQKTNTLSLKVSQQPLIRDHDIQANMEGNTEERDFHHPYTPYPIQLDFMNALYQAIEDKCIGIFESPTGSDGPPYISPTYFADGKS